MNLDQLSEEAKKTIEAFDHGVSALWNDEVALTSRLFASIVVENNMPIYAEKKHGKVYVSFYYQGIVYKSTFTSLDYMNLLVHLEPQKMTS